MQSSSQERKITDYTNLTKLLSLTYWTFMHRKNMFARNFADHGTDAQQYGSKKGQKRHFLARMVSQKVIQALRLRNLSIIGAPDDTMPGN
jgi:hypothetical protein